MQKYQGKVLLLFYIPLSFLHNVPRAVNIVIFLSPIFLYVVNYSHIFESYFSIRCKLLKNNFFVLDKKNLPLMIVVLYESYNLVKLMFVK